MNQDEEINDIINQSDTCREELIKQNIYYKNFFYYNKINMTESEKIPSILNRVQTTTHLYASKHPEILDGNFFINANENIRIENEMEKELIVRYVGDDKIDKINEGIKKAKNIIDDLIDDTYQDSDGVGFNNETVISPTLPDNILSNALLFKIFIYLTSFQMNTQSIKEKFINELSNIYQKCNTDDIKHQIIKNFARFSKYNQKFYYLSCKMEESHEMLNIKGTYLELYCSICFKYDCINHGVKETKDFGIYEFYDWDNAVNTFRKAMTNTNEDFINTYVNSLKDLNGNYIKTYSDKKIFKIIKDIEGTKYTKYDSQHPEHCSKDCYINNTYVYLPLINDLNEIEAMYITKLFEIFLYDPCKIYISLKNISSSNISCLKIFKWIIVNFPIDEILKIVKNPSKETTKKKKQKNPISKIRYGNIIEAEKEHFKKDYVPCLHNSDEICGKDCNCTKRGFCEKYCICNKNLCQNRFPGCKCTSNCRTVQCPCFAATRECDDDICLKCVDHELSNCNEKQIRKKVSEIQQQNRNSNSRGVSRVDKSIKCWNKLCQFKYSAKLAIAKSSISGWGLFALEFISKNQFIKEYTGELLESVEEEIRDISNDIEETTYIFSLTNDNSIDSKYIGNSTRFANHSKNPLLLNAFPKIIFSQGNYKICLIASRDIKNGEEILFDYDGCGDLWKKFPWIMDSYPNQSLVKNKTGENKNSNKADRKSKNLSRKTSNINYDEIQKNKSSQDYDILHEDYISQEYDKFHPKKNNKYYEKFKNKHNLDQKIDELFIDLS